MRGVRQLPPRALGGELTPLRRRNPERSNLHRPGGLKSRRCRIVSDVRLSGRPLKSQDRVPGFREAPCACDCARTPLPLNVPCRNSRVRKSTRRFPVGSLIAK